MSDLISRQAILKHIEKKRQDALMIDDLRESNIIMMGMKLLEEAVRNQPSVQPEHTETHSCDYQRTETHDWIPVTEALPKEEDCPMDCLVTRKSKFIGNYTDMAVCEKNGTWTHEDWDAIVLGDVKDGKSTGLISTRDDNIIAWMPLPEPWKGGQG